MAYDDLGDGKPILRDYLAVERMRLANERTLPAYVRTALFMLVTALTFAKLYENDAVVRTVSLAFAPVVLAIAGFGYQRFYTTKKKLGTFEREHSP